MTIVLSNHIEASERSADELEREVELNIRAAIPQGIRMVATQLDSLLRSLANDGEEMGSLVGAFASACRSEGEAFPVDLAVRTFALFARVDRTMQRAASLAKLMEERGQTFRNKGAFLKAWREIKVVTSMSQERYVALSQRDVAAEQYVSLADFEHELSGGPLN